MDKLIFEDEVSVIIVINEASEDLNMVLSKIKITVDVIEVQSIEKYKDTNKYIVYFEENSLKKINKVVLSGQKRGIAPQAPRYATYSKLLSARTLSDLWD